MGFSASGLQHGSRRLEATPGTLNGREGWSVTDIEGLPDVSSMDICGA